VAAFARRIFDGVTAVFGSRVTRVARVVTIRESVNPFTVGGSELSDRHFRFGLPGLVPNSDATVFFRVRPLMSDSRIQVRIRQTIVARFTYDQPSNAPFHWHKVVPPGAFDAERNELIFSVAANGAAEFSDVLILYQSDETTVKAPEELLASG
jgi:hypothetical protein